MSFFDKKEDVMHIELTPYGKFLLSKGKFKPEFYAFYDDDIVYDAQWATPDGDTFTEVQKDIHNRIKDQVRVKPLFTRFSAEERVSKNKSQKVANSSGMYDSEKFQLSTQEYREKNYSLSLPLGTSNNLYDYAPAWSISFLKGGIDRGVSYVTGSHNTTRIPQLDLKDIVITARVDEDFSPDEDIENPECQFDGGIFHDESEDQPFDDGTFVYVEDDYIMIDVEELNGEFGNENIEIQLFKKSTKHSGLGQTTNEETWEPLYFPIEFSNIDKNGLLMDEEQNDLTEEELDFINSNKAFVSHFLQVLIDKEIPENLLCIPELAGRVNVFGKQKINCETEDATEGRTIDDLYNSEFDDEAEFCQDDLEDTSLGGDTGSGTGGSY